MPKVRMIFVGDGGDRAAATIAALNVAAALIPHGAKVTFVTTGKDCPMERRILVDPLPRKVSLGNHEFEFAEQPTPKTVHVAVVGWCDDWRIVAVATTEAKARAACEAAMDKPLFYDERAKPEYQWTYEVPFIE